jgi:hypothetical protein
VQLKGLNLSPMVSLKELKVASIIAMFIKRNQELED